MNKQVVHHIASRFDLEDAVREKGFTLSHHQAMTGSQYVTINGIRYRLADHDQPSWYQVRNYIDCSSFQQIYDLALSAWEKSLELNIVDEFLYDGKSDEFYPNPSYIRP